jgi:two-component system, NtrC family, sensor histidine kinase HydH
MVRGLCLSQGLDYMDASGKRTWLTIPPIVIIGAVFIMALVLVIAGIGSIRTQRTDMEKLLLAQGTMLIRSFEAGAKTGLLGVQWDSPQIGKWLMEAAHQPGVLYIFITDHRGRILAHSDQSQVGKTYGQDLDLDAVSQSVIPKWRIRDNSIFELLNRGTPLPGQLTTYIRTNSPHEWLRVQITPKESEEITGLVMFVGLDMRPLKASQEAATRNTVIGFAILLLMGFTGIIMLFIVHRYQSARTSLSHIRAFSDTLVSNMPVGIVSVDVAGKVSSMNETAAALLRVNMQGILGKNADEELPASVVHAVGGFSLPAAALAKEVECAIAGDRTVHLEVTTTPLNENDGTTLGHIVLLRDLTEIRRLRKEVERSQRLASLGRLAAGVAHEIRNPLSSIKGFATYFGERYRDVPEDRETAEIMVQEVERLNRVVSELLEFARPMNLQKKVLSLQLLLENALKMIEQQAKERQICIATDFSPDVAPVPLDEDKMRQVFLNLYLNSIQAMEHGGVLTTMLSRSESGEPVIRITDTGKGIETRDLGKIFDPYFTTKPAGTGLGLAIVHRIVEAHGGTIHIESGTGKGTSVSVTMPVG